MDLLLALVWYLGLQILSWSRLKRTLGLSLVVLVFAWVNPKVWVTMANSEIEAA